jgi:hypothetical protein
VALNGPGRINVSGGQSLVKIQQMFFDRPAVVKAAGRAKTAALARFAGYVRSVARRSMRRRKSQFAHSAPGSPPFAKSGELRDLLFFGYDAKTGTFVVGPLGFKGSDVPSLHEHGGTRAAGKGEFLLLKNSPGRDHRGKFVSRGTRKVAIKGTVKYPARPFMAPALKTSIPKFAASFRGTVTR